MKRTIGGATIASLLLSTHASVAQAEKVNHSPPAYALLSDGGCLPIENWTTPLGGAVLPRSLEALLRTAAPGTKVMPDEPEEAVNQYVRAASLRISLKSPTLLPVLDYITWRSVFRMGLLQLSARGFRELLSAKLPKSLASLKVAAASCLNRVLERYPSTDIALPDQDVILQLDELAAIHPQVVHERWKLTSRVAARHADGEIDLKAFDSNKRAQLYYKGIAEAGRMDAPAAIESLESFLKSSADLKNSFLDLDRARMLLARMYRLQGKPIQAIKLYERVGLQSNWYLRSLEERTWANFEKGDLRKATGLALAFESPRLIGSFVPEVASLVVHSQFDLCRYRETYRSIQFFKKRYSPSFVWLSKFMGTQRAKAAADPYSLAIRFIERQNGMPTKVGVQWTQSPGFIALQQQINFLLDEKDQAARLLAAVKGNSAAAKELRTQIQNYSSTELKTSQKELVVRINDNLRVEAGIMLARLSEFSDMTQILEAQALRMAGMSLVNRSAAGIAATAPGTAPSLQLEASKLYWRKIAVDEVDKVELWADEFGLMTSEMSSECPR